VSLTLFVLGPGSWSLASAVVEFLLSDRAERDETKIEFCPPTDTKALFLASRPLLLLPARFLLLDNISNDDPFCLIALSSLLRVMIYC
jgi:hypothetical protein